MKNNIGIILAACLLAATASAGKTDKTPDAQALEIMKKYEAAAKPGDQHKMLSGIAGNWNYTSKMWDTAGAEPHESKGKTDFKMILGGRWLQQQFKGKAMGHPFEGMGLIGYDNVKGKFESIWLDTMSTGAMQSEGTYEDGTKTLKDSGTMSCPLSADKTQEFRSELQFVNNKKLVFSMFGKGPTDGPEFKMMEITYSR